MEIENGSLSNAGFKLDWCNKVIECLYCTFRVEEWKRQEVADHMLNCTMEGKK